MKRNSKKTIKITILCLILIAGMTVFLYPLISNLINTSSQTKVISNYEDELKKLSEQEKLEKIRLAQEYNASLAEEKSAIRDPFSGEAVTEQTVSFMNIGDIMGYLEIPKIDIKIPIYQGTSEEVLQNAVGWMEGTSLPIGGTSTHSVLTGHRGLPTSRLFTDLDQLSVGDTFFVRGIEGILAYQVESAEIILPEEVGALSIIEGKDYVTLLTCHPYMVNSHRLIVRGERIAYSGQLDSDEAGEAVNKTMPFSQKYREYIIICGSFIILFILIAVIKKVVKRKRK